VEFELWIWIEQAKIRKLVLIFNSAL